MTEEIRKQPGDFDTLMLWAGVIRSARSIYSGGPGVYNIRVLIDEDGNISAQAVCYTRIGPKLTSIDRLLDVAGGDPEKIKQILFLLSS